MKFEISRSELIILENLIEEHHELYIKLYKDTLKPKMHNMLHYKEVYLLFFNFLLSNLTRLFFYFYRQLRTLDR